MKHEMLELLRCPCGGELSLRDVNAKGILETNGLVDSWESRPDGEVDEGLLLCKCGAVYPIIGKVPRLIENPVSAYPEFFRMHEEQVRRFLAQYGGERASRIEEEPEDFGGIRASFGKEWTLYDYSTDKTWGWDQEERKRVFLDDIGMSASSLQGRLVLDAGCGNGVLTATLSSLGIRIVGLDISDSVARAEQSKSALAKDRSDSVHFVQGNLFCPPLAKGAFDVVYSSGVLHHTPDTRETFFRIVPLAKKGGRVYIWVYGPRGLLVRVFQAHGRLLRRFLSLKWLFYYCCAISPLYQASSSLLSALRICKFRKRTIREIRLDLFDAFSPRYNHRHTEAEVVRWFHEAGFENVTVSGRQKHGFGVYGDKSCWDHSVG